MSHSIPKNQLAQYEARLDATIKEEFDFNEIDYLPPALGTEASIFPKTKIEDVTGSLKYEGESRPIEELGYPE